MNRWRTASASLSSGIPVTGRLSVCNVTLATMCALAVACGGDTTEPGVGALDLTVITTGRDLDADGYTVTVDAGNPVTVPTDGTLSIPDLSAGQHTVTLAALAS